MDETVDFYERCRTGGTLGLPKYAHLREMMLDAIKSGLWKPGDKLPTELELAERTSLSLGTVQRALRELSGEGIVVRRQGFGTFVAETGKHLEDPWHCRFLDDRGNVLPIFTKTLKRQRVTEQGPWLRYLPYRSRGVLRIDRRININDELNVFSRFFADPVLLEPLMKGPLEGLDGANLKVIIARECHLPITQITHDVKVVAFDTEVAKIVGVRTETSGLHLQAVARAGSDINVYYQEFFVPPTDRVMRFSEGPDVSKRSAVA